MNFQVLKIWFCGRLTFMLSSAIIGERRVHHEKVDFPAFAGIVSVGLDGGNPCKQDCSCSEFGPIQPDA
jgi:hypothetical protein